MRRESEYGYHEDVKQQPVKRENCQEMKIDYLKAFDSSLVNLAIQKTAIVIKAMLAI